MLLAAVSLMGAQLFLMSVTVVYEFSAFCNYQYQLLNAQVIKIETIAVTRDPNQLQ